MVRKSFIERQVEMLGQVLARILGLKERGDASGALEAVRAGGRQLAGMDLDTLTRLSDEAVLSLLTSPQTGLLDAAKAVIAASLLDEQAQIRESQGETNAARAARTKAAVLFSEALAQENELRAPFRERFANLAAALASDGGPVPAGLLRRLARGHEAVGDFGHAEDAFFALRESGDPAASADARAFYERLLALPDAELVRGGLPRDEVRDGLASVSSAA